MRIKHTAIYAAFLAILLTALISCGGDSGGETSHWASLSSKRGQIPEPGPSKQQTASMILDVDNDGDSDFIIGSRQKGPSLILYLRSQDGWEKYIIEDDTLPIEAGGAFYDIDGDGDQDIVFGADATDNKMWWWENPFPHIDKDKSWTRRIIKKSGANKHHDQIFGDFDGDGKVELVFWNQKDNKLFMAEIPEEPKKAGVWNFAEIFSSASESEGLAAADIDLDGQVDIVGGGHWFKHLEGNNFEAVPIDKGQAFSRAKAGQLVEGGRPEVVFVAGDGVGPLRWYEWENGSWKGNDLLKADVDHGHSLEIEDMDGDGNLDIFAAEMRLGGENEDAHTWIFYGDGKGNFTKRQIASGYGNHESKIGDMDGDNDPDILVKPYDWDTPRVDILLNNWNWKRHVVDADKPERAVFIMSADLNNDGNEDIISGGYWYKNPGNIDGKWERIPVGGTFNNAAIAGDWDGDGDVDLLGTEGKGSEPNPSLVWAENDGTGGFSILKNIKTADGDFLQGVAANSFHGDGTQIALSWHEEGKGIQMLAVPDNPAGEEWKIYRISNYSQNEALSSGDIDRDGDQDLLLGTKWLRNNVSSWDTVNVFETDDPPDRNILADMNRDGKLDAVVGYEAISKPGKIAWYEQNGESGSEEWKEHIIGIITGPMSLDVGDVDNDGDLDVVAGEHNIKAPERAGLYFFENVDGRGNKWLSHVIHIGDEHHDGAQLVDIDSDGDLDILSIGWTHPRVLIYENKGVSFMHNTILFKDIINSGDKM